MCIRDRSITVTPTRPKMPHHSSHARKAQGAVATKDATSPWSTPSTPTLRTRLYINIHSATPVLTHDEAAALDVSIDNNRPTRTHVCYPGQKFSSKRFWNHYRSSTRCVACGVIQPSLQNTTCALSYSHSEPLSPCKPGNVFAKKVVTLF